MLPNGAFFINVMYNSFLTRTKKDDTLDLTERGLIPIPIGKNSLFSPAFVGDQTLVVFIHGFRGKALSTWLAFPDFIDKYDGLRDADILFYGYPSRPQRLQNIAINLRLDIDQIWRGRENLGPTASRILEERDQSTKQWSRILFVAHSLGAVVLRRALFDCCLDNRSHYNDYHWSRNSALCLFAPAHTGANVLGLINETLFGIGIPIAPFLKLIYPCLQDLEEGSQTLVSLQSDYKSMSPSMRSFTNATIVALAEFDNVVEPTRFPGDPIPDQFRGRGHINLCKPNEEFIDPVHTVYKIMQENTLFGKNHASDIKPK